MTLKTKYLLQNFKNKSLINLIAYYFHFGICYVSLAITIKLRSKRVFAWIKFFSSVLAYWDKPSLTEVVMPQTLIAIKMATHSVFIIKVSTFFYGFRRFYWFLTVFISLRCSALCCNWNSKVSISFHDDRELLRFVNILNKLTDLRAKLNRYFEYTLENVIPFPYLNQGIWHSLCPTLYLFVYYVSITKKLEGLDVYTVVYVLLCTNNTMCVNSITIELIVL